jgi:hypothetical protein
MSNYFKISKENSIRFADRTTSTKKNDYNSLSYEDINPFAYDEIQKFQTNDTITTQFRSNYTTVTATLTDENNVVTNLTVNKKTTNIGRQKRYDGVYYNYKGEGVYTGIYFNTGNEYTYGTSTIIGTHSFNGGYPEFAIIGESVEIVGVGTFTIDRLVYDEDIDSNVILVTNAYTGAVTSAEIQSQYDILPYEVYEFDIDFSSFLGYYYVTITNAKVGYATITFRSEILDIEQMHDALEIVYYNTINDDILYSTGIQHKLRIPFYRIYDSSSNENEINITDTTANLIDSNIDEKNTFLFTELSIELMRKLKIALSSEIVIINDEGYISDGKFSTTPIENTNQYTLEGTMIKTGVNYYVNPVDLALIAAKEYIARCEADGAIVNTTTSIFATYVENY